MGKRINKYEYDKLNQGERHLFDWQFGYAGGFVLSLFVVIGVADSGNLERLRRGFPEEIQAYQSFASKPGWWQDIESRLFITDEPEEVGK